MNVTQLIDMLSQCNSQAEVTFSSIYGDRLNSPVTGMVYNEECVRLTDEDLT